MSQVPCQSNWHQIQPHFHPATQLVHTVRSAHSAERCKNLYWIKSGLCAVVCGQVHGASEISALCRNKGQSKIIEQKGGIYQWAFQRKIQCKESLFAYLNNKSPAPPPQMSTQHFAVLSFPPSSPLQASPNTFSHQSIHPRSDSFETELCLYCVTEKGDYKWMIPCMIMTCRPQGNTMPLT